tara:strand:+ start:374 stop:1225 length:852 start_codon:yes stop_codon:yes gene_type:complete
MLKIDKPKSNSSLGVTVSGINLSNKISPEEKAVLNNLWSKFYILIFPNQILEHKEFENFSLTFGEFGHDPFIESIDKHPNIIEVKKEADEKASHFGGSWHSDWSFQKTPPSATLLHSKIIPPVGGDTLFANTILAYEGLPQETKEEIDGLKVIHSAALPYADDGFYALEDEKDRTMKIKPSKEAKKTFSHPLVRTHPISKQRGLFINPVYSMGIEGFEKEESDKLLNKLYLHMIQDKYIYKHSWKKDMLVIWDNRAVMHQATGGYDGYDRLLHRITIAGEQPS